MNVLICNKSYILKLITFYACIPHLHKLYIQECLILFYFFSDILWFDLFKQNVNVHFSCQENKIFNHIIVFNIIIQSYILSYHLHTDNVRLYFWFLFNIICHRVFSGWRSRVRPTTVSYQRSETMVALTPLFGAQQYNIKWGYRECC